MNTIPSTLFVDFQQPYSDNLERVGRFCLKPIHILLGQSYSINIQNERIEGATFCSWNRVHRLAVFVFSAVLFPLFLGCTALGVVATLGSPSHRSAFQTFKKCLEGQRGNLTVLERIDENKKANFLSDLAHYKEKLHTPVSGHEKETIQKALYNYLETFPFSNLMPSEILELLQLCYLYDIGSQKTLNITLGQMAELRAYIESLKPSAGAYHLASVSLLAQLGGNVQANLKLMKSFSVGEETSLMGCVWDFAVAPTTKEKLGNRSAIVATLWMYDDFDAFEKHFPSWSLSNPQLVDELLAQAEGKQIDWLLRSRPASSTHPIWDRIRGEHLEKLFSLSPQELFPLFVAHKSREATSLLFSKFRDHNRLLQILVFFKPMDWRAHWEYITLGEKLTVLTEANEQQVIGMFYAAVYDTFGKEFGTGWEIWRELEQILLPLPEKYIPNAITGIHKAIRERYKVELNLENKATPEARRAILHRLHEFVRSVAKDR